MRAATGCVRCDSAPWPGLADSWRRIADDPGAPSWVKRLDVMRCADCGRYWGASYDQYDCTWYSSIRPLPPEFGELLEPGAGVRELLRFVGADASLRESISVAQSFLGRVSFDPAEALRGIAALLRPENRSEANEGLLVLAGAVILSEPGRLAWLAARDRGVRLDLDRQVIQRLQSAVELSDDWRGRGELREKLEQWDVLLR
jgi:hypothetical protein